MTQAPVLAEVERSGRVESQHRGHLVVVDSDGSLVMSLGDPQLVAYPRSSVKPLQAVGMLEIGLDFCDAQLALTTASHSGEPFHAEGVRRMLAASGLSEDDLLCPPDLPYADAARAELLAAGGCAQRVLMNCSGKHAAMLRVCVLNGWSTDSYLDPLHPLQVHLQNSVSRQTGAEIAQASIDGCGAPLWPVPLVALARAFAGFGSDEPGRRVRQAIRDFPQFVGGTDRDITALIAGVDGLIGKDGAEAVQAMSVAVGGREFGIAIKIEDGAQRARPVVAASVLVALGLNAAVISEQLQAPVLGGGVPVGSIHPSEQLAGLAGTL